jgi:hypothetical protein
MHTIHHVACEVSNGDVQKYEPPAAAVYTLKRINGHTALQVIMFAAHVSRTLNIAPHVGEHYGCNVTPLIFRSIDSGSIA